MNAHIFDFDGDFRTCPVCHRTLGIKLRARESGLYTCAYCQERLVVSNSGHYVRDPFTIRQLQTGQLLRRQSQPLARILRDFGVPFVILGSVVLLSVTLVATERLKWQDNWFNGLMKRLAKPIELIQN